MIKFKQLNEDLEHLSDELKDKVVVALDDTQAQVALETDDKKEEVKKDTKEAVDATNELAKETNADGGAKEIFESVEPLKEEDDVIEEPSEEAQTEYGVNSAITQLIKERWDNIDMLNSYLASFIDLDEDTKSLLQDMVDNDMVYIGLLEGKLKK